MKLSPTFIRTCQFNGILLSPLALAISVASQKVWLFQKRAPGTTSGYALTKTFRCSTSRFGTGQLAGSNRTPLGLHRVAEKIGGGWPVGTVFKSRRPVGFTWQGLPEAMITTRILWLDGLEPGFNRGGDVDSHSRHIYIHGTGDEPSLGRPASCGCIHLAADELIPLFDRLAAGSLVWIQQ